MLRVVGACRKHLFAISALLERVGHLLVSLQSPAGAESLVTNVALERRSRVFVLVVVQSHLREKSLVANLAGVRKNILAVGVILVHVAFEIVVRGEHHGTKWTLDHGLWRSSGEDVLVSWANISEPRQDGGRGVRQPIKPQPF